MNHFSQQLNMSHISQCKPLARVLPTATQFRKVGLITYGPGPYRQCNIELDFRPIPDATRRVMNAVNRLNPGGKTPLTETVERAAEVLDYRSKPGVVVVLTDGEETCGGKPCTLGKSLRADGLSLTVHVIGFQLKNFMWLGTQSILDVICLAEKQAASTLRRRPKRISSKRSTRRLAAP